MSISSEITSKPLTASEADELAYHDIMANFPKFGLAAFHHRTTKGKVMEFNRRAWQVAIYKDTANRIVVQKPSQIGLTDWALVTMFFHASRGEVPIYVLPSDKDRNSFVPRRLDRTILRVPYYHDNYMQKRKDSDMKSQKTLFGVDCIFVGSNSETNFYEKPCDVLIIDEYDKCNHDVITYAHDRYGASDNPYVYILGNPTIEGFGINAEYNNSDKKVWMTKCPACNKYQELDWFNHIVMQDDNGKWIPRGGMSDDNKDLSVLCGGCSKPIDRLIPARWVNEFQYDDVSGYRISKIFGDAREHHVIREMFDDWIKAQGNQTKLERFYNNILGIPYEAEGSKITEKMMGNCKVDYEYGSPTGNPTIAGCDVGSVLNLQISEIVNGKRRKVFVGTVRDFDELSFKCKEYNVRRGVIDALPEGHATKEFVRKNSGWLMCFFVDSDDKRMALKPDYINKTINVGRTEIMDASYQDWAIGNLEVPAQWRNLDNGDFVKQMKAPTRIQKIKPNGTIRYVWQEGSQADHHRLTDTYEYIADHLNTLNFAII